VSLREPLDAQPEKRMARADKQQNRKNRCKSRPKVEPRYFLRHVSSPISETAMIYDLNLCFISVRDFSAKLYSHELAEQFPDRTKSPSKDKTPIHEYFSPRSVSVTLMRRKRTNHYYRGHGTNNSVKRIGTRRMRERRQCRALGLTTTVTVSTCSCGEKIEQLGSKCSHRLQPWLRAAEL
jgi:hypothetical protein